MATFFPIGKDYSRGNGITISTVSGLQTKVGIMWFTMSIGTSITAGTNSTSKIYIGAAGITEFMLCEENEDERKKIMLTNGEALFTKPDTVCEMTSATGSVFIEITLEEDICLNEAVNIGEVVRLENLIPYKKGSFFCMDLALTEKMKFILMSFDKEDTFNPDSANGDILLFALNGEATVAYKGRRHSIQAGESFRVEKGAKYSVSVESPFKMGVLTAF